MATVRERTLMMNNLTCLLQSLIGKSTKVELRNEKTVYGHVESVDSLMNTVMVNAKLVDVFQESTFFETMYIQGKNIRFVHIPDSINIAREIHTQIDVLRRPLRHEEGNKKLGKDKLRIRLRKEKELRDAAKASIGGVVKGSI